MAHVHFRLAILVVSWISVTCAGILVSSVRRGDSGRYRRYLLLRWAVSTWEGVTRMVADALYSDDTRPTAVLLANRCFLWK